MKEKRIAIILFKDSYATTTDKVDAEKISNEILSVTADNGDFKSAVFDARYYKHTDLMKRCERYNQAQSKANVLKSELFSP